MFDKLAPVPIKNPTHRKLLIFSMTWFLVGTWIDASAHSYLNVDLESFFTPWHAVLYSGYAFSVLSQAYVKTSIKDYSIDVGILGAVIFGIGGGLDLLWHTFLGIEQGVEPLVSPSHLMLFLGAFLMLAYVFASRPSQESLDTPAVITIGAALSLITFITQFLHPYLNVGAFLWSREEELAAGSLFFQALLASMVFVFIIRFRPTKNQIFIMYTMSFVYLSFHSVLGNLELMAAKVLWGIVFGYLASQITNWYYKTQNKQKMQIATSLVAGLYGLLFILYLFSVSIYFEQDMVWRFYGLGGLVTVPLLFGYMIGSLGVSPVTREIVSN
jgi:hypothetical protein|tara:strand:+ start:71 stop:1054 length:984 start_codon:yes stop_codon:yes gene_type:complete